MAIWDIVPDFVCLLFLRLYNEWVKSNFQLTQCLKIIEKVSFLIVSEVSYDYILSGQKFIKNAKNSQFWRVFGNIEASGQTVLPDRSIFIRQKLVKNAQIKKFKCDFLSNFQTM